MKKRTGSELQNLSSKEILELIECGRKSHGLSKEDMNKTFVFKQGMKNKPIQVEKYGKTVWSNVEMDDLRKTECLCLNCSKMLRQDCQTAKLLYNACKDFNIAMAITRCPDFEHISQEIAGNPFEHSGVVYVESKKPWWKFWSK